MKIEKFIRSTYTLVVETAVDGTTTVYRTDTDKKHVMPGLGDRLEQLLTGFGITQETYKAAKVKFGAMPTCNCDKRKAWLNKVGRHFGIGK